MEAIAKKQRRLNFEKIFFSGTIISSEQALKDVTPIEWNDEVKNGEKKATVFHPSTFDKQVND